MALTAAIVAAASVIAVAMVCATIVTVVRERRAAASADRVHREERLAAVEREIEDHRNKINTHTIELSGRRR